MGFPVPSLADGGGGQVRCTADPTGKKAVPALRTKGPSHGPGAAAGRPSWGQVHADRIQLLGFNHIVFKNPNQHRSQLITGTDFCFLRSHRDACCPEGTCPQEFPHEAGAPRRHRVPSAKCNSACGTGRWLLSVPGSVIPPELPSLRSQGPTVTPRRPSPASPQAAHSRRGSLTRGRASWPGWLAGHRSAKACRDKGRWRRQGQGASGVRRNAVHRTVSKRSSAAHAGRWLVAGSGRACGEQNVSTAPGALGATHPGPVPASTHDLTPRKRISPFFLFLKLFIFLRKTKPKHIPACSC